MTSTKDGMKLRVRGDFNGLFGEMLCLSHSDTCVDEQGKYNHPAANNDINCF
jgi:hypothetical protein